MSTPKYVNTSVNTKEITSTSKKYTATTNVVAKITDAIITNTDSNSADYNILKVSKERVYDRRETLVELVFRHYEEISTADLLKLQLTKKFIENQAIIDSIKFNNSLKRSDTVNANEFIKKISSKVLVDSYAIFEIVKKANTLIFKDTFYFSDDADVAKSTSFNESMSNTDSYKMSVTKVTTDASLINEFISFVKSLVKADSVSYSDSITKNSSINRIEVVSGDDSVYLDYNDYCDDTYIDSNYVGVFLQISN